MENIFFLGLILSSIIGAGTIGSTMMDDNDFGMMNGDHGMMGNNGMMDECGEIHDEMQEHCEEYMEEECEDMSWEECEECMHEHCEHEDHEH